MVYSYCLLPNHFHILVKIKNKKTVLKAAEKISSIDRIKKEATKKGNDIIASIVSEQFRRFFMAYSKAINNQTGRHGSLFTKRFKRKQINKFEYLQRLVFYIHNNPVHHEICENFKKYKWNTYQKILSSQKSKLMKADVIDLFENKENYVYMHKSRYDTDDISEIED